MNKKKLLIVDDTPTNLDVMSAVLQDEYKIMVANNGKKAIEIAKKNLPDLILLDVMMPEMNGYEVCKQLQNMRRTKHIPVIFVSAMGEAEDECEGFDAGGVDYITKPVNSKLMLARIKSQLELKEMRAQLHDDLRKTLTATFDMLSDVMSVARPDVYARSMRLRSLTKFIAENLKLKNVWGLELAAGLSQLGCMSVDTETLEKISRGEQLSSQEMSDYIKHTELSCDMLADIPYMEPIVNFISLIKPLDTTINFSLDEKIKDTLIPAVFYFTEQINYFESEAALIDDMHDRFAVEIVSQLAQLKDGELQETEDMPLGDLYPGLILAEDLLSDNGMIIVYRDAELTANTINRINTRWADKLTKIKTLKVIKIQPKE